MFTYVLLANTERSATTASSVVPIAGIGIAVTPLSFQGKVQCES
jgi:hypothetical protein